MYPRSGTGQSAEERGGIYGRTVSEHPTNIFVSGELDEEAVIRKFRITAADGETYATQHYKLDPIISVRYRGNSVRAIQFRQWATRVLREFAIKGFVLDRQWLENGSFMGEDYFGRLLAEIREIRMSDCKFCQTVTDIYGTAVDYNRDALLASSRAILQATRPVKPPRIAPLPLIGVSRILVCLVARC